jgi:glycerol-3-phosphate dehydrogenase
MPRGEEAVAKALGELGLYGVEAREWRQSIRLEGEVESWPQYIAAGYAAGGKGYKGVINDITVKGIIPAPAYLPVARDRSLEGRSFDVAIIGGGVIGCAVARELTRWNLRVAVLEKEDDLAKQTSSRNNGMIHPGIAPAIGTKKLEYNIRGNRMYTQVAEELGFQLERCGSVVMLEKGWHRLGVPYVRWKALKKGVDGVIPLSRREVFQREPNAIRCQRGGVLLPSAGVVAPYKVTVAYAENAVENGAEVFLNTAALGFVLEKGRIVGVKTNRGLLRAGVVVNAAGVWADKIADYADDRFFTLHGRKGTIAILDKNTRSLQNSVLAMPQIGVKSHTKGGGLNPTVEGNILMGPTATEIPHREDWSTQPEELEFLLSRLLRLNTRLQPGDIITYFAGVRACTFDEDFIIEPSDYVGNLVHAAGIQSPGLASAPAIAADVAAMAVEILKETMEVKPNPTFNPKRRVSPELAALTLEERAKLIRAYPAYGRIVCRCEVISEGEIIAAIKSPIPATSLDAVKRRVRAGMGRCQGGFCTPALLEIVSRETGLEPEQITKGRLGSELLTGKTKAEAGGGEEGDKCQQKLGM